MLKPKLIKDNSATENKSLSPISL